MRLILVRMSFWGKCIAYKQEVYVTGTQTEIDGGFFAFFFLLMWNWHLMSYTSLDGQDVFFLVLSEG